MLEAGKETDSAIRRMVSVEINGKETLIWLSQYLKLKNITTFAKIIYHT